jgi:hypothetical protein
VKRRRTPAAATQLAAATGRDEEFIGADVLLGFIYPLADLFD